MTRSKPFGSKLMEQLRITGKKITGIAFLFAKLMEQEERENSEEETPELKLIDTHCHPHDDDRKLKKIATLKTDRVCIMGVRESDWGTVLKLKTAYPNKVIGALGVHPWYAHSWSGSTLSKLKSLLHANPNCIVGEIGLDKTNKVHCDYKQHVEIFKMQLELAAELNRPVSIHCVRDFGTLFDIFKQMSKFPPAIAMHSYSGSADMANSYLKLPKIGKVVFFSFSSCINMSSDKTLDVIKSIPQNRLLIESDQNTPVYIDDDMLEMCKTVANCRGWTVEEAAEITYSNSAEFLKSIIKL